MTEALFAWAIRIAAILLCGAVVAHLASEPLTEAAIGVHRWMTMIPR